MAAPFIFSPVTQHITLNDPDGSSSFLTPSPSPPTVHLSPSSRISYIYSAPPSIAINAAEHKNTDLDYHVTAPTSGNLRSFPPPSASVCVVMDLAPNSGAAHEHGFMHKTQTLDYIVMIEGEAELTLYAGEGKEGEKKILKKGDVVIQRACMHSWRNPSKTEPARFAAISLGCEGAVEGGMTFPGQ